MLWKKKYRPSIARHRTAPKKSKWRRPLTFESLETRQLLAADYVGQTIQITNHAAEQSAPSIDGDLIAWVDFRNGPQGEIYGYNLSTQQEFPIATGGIGKRYPQVDGNFVTWLELESQTSRFLYTKNLTTGITQTVVSNAAYIDEYYSVVGNNVYFAARIGNSTSLEVFSFDLTTSVRTPISGTPGFDDRSPNAKGQYLTWGSGPDVIYKDLSTGTVTTNTTPENWMEPVVDGDLIVAVSGENSSGSKTITAYDISSGKFKNLEPVLGYNTHPSIDGRFVTWVNAPPSGPATLRGYDLVSGVKFQIITDPIVYQTQQQMEVSGNRVVWTRTNAAFDQFDIFVTELTPTAQISGTKFNDLDGDGSRDAGEPGLEGWTIYLDLDDDGVHDNGEPSTVTAADGQYTFTGVEPGTYVIGEVPQANWQQTSPNQGLFTQQIKADTTWRNIGPAGNNEGQSINNVGLAWEGTNVGWNSSLTYDDSDAAGWSSAIRNDPVAHPDNIWPNGNGLNGSTPAYFRKQILIPGTPTDGNVTLGVDDDIFLYVNGQTVFSDSNGLATDIFTHGITAALAPGVNLIAAKAHDQQGAEGWNANFTIKSIPRAGTHAVQVEAGQTVTGLNFGNRFVAPPDPAEIHGYKWDDQDGDGTWDAGEPGLNGWTIELVQNGQVIASTVTGDDPDTAEVEVGAYGFTDLSAGSYSVREVLQTGWQQIFPGGAGEHAIVLATSQIVTGAFGTAASPNFGNQLIPTPILNEIHGFKWNDLDGDGAWDDGEPGANGWTIELLQNDQVIVTTVTGDDPATPETEVGAYGFTGLSAGTYTVREVLQSGWQQTYPGAGSYTVNLGASGVTTVKNIATGIVDATGDKIANLGSDTDYAIGTGSADQVGAVPVAKQTPLPPPYMGDDASANSRWIVINSAVGEQGIDVPAGDYFWELHVDLTGFDAATAQLTGLRYAADNKMEQLTINGQVAYTRPISFGSDFGPFVDVGTVGLGLFQPGDNVLTFRVLNDGTAVTALALRLEGLVEADTVASEIVAGRFGIAETPNFGNQLIPIPPAEIHGFKWDDVDGDGAWDQGEPGLNGWTIELVQDGQVITSTVTGDDPSTPETEVGAYGFTGLVAGTYTVREVPQQGWQQTYPGDSGEHLVVLATSQIVSGAFGTAETPNFGNQLIPIAPAEIHGYKWNDVDGDNVWDQGEPGLNGWTIELVQDGQVVASTVTGDDPNTPETEVGAYAFTGLDAGTYTVREVLQTGWQQTYPGSGGQHQVVLATSQIVSGAFGTAAAPNFGNRLIPPVGDAVIRGYKWNDLDGDGVWDETEPALSGWTIQLVRDGQVVAETVTGDDPTTPAVETGVYRFSGLVAGTYTVREVFQAGWQQTFPSSSAGHQLTLANHQVISGRVGGSRVPNFGNQVIPAVEIGAEIHGWKWNDRDGDRVWDAGEPGLNGWTIQLVQSGQVVATTVTGDDPSTPQVEVGSYQFTGLPAGSYTLREVLEDGWRQTYPSTSNSGPAVFNLALTSGQIIRGGLGLAALPNFGNQLVPKQNGKCDPPQHENPRNNDRCDTNPGDRGGKDGKDKDGKDNEKNNCQTPGNSSNKGKSDKKDEVDVRSKLTFASPQAVDRVMADLGKKR